jgi:hypothetical protein
MPSLPCVACVLCVCLCVECVCWLLCVCVWCVCSLYFFCKEGGGGFLARKNMQRVNGGVGVNTSSQPCVQCGPVQERCVCVCVVCVVCVFRSVLKKNGGQLGQVCVCERLIK